MMKKSFVTLLFVLWSWGVLSAQQSENLSRNVLATVPENEVVEYGEFQAELMKTHDYKTTMEGYWFSYIFTTKNKYTDKCNIMLNGNPLLQNRNMRVRTYRLGSSSDKSIFVMKNLDKEADDIGYGMEVVRAYGIPQLICDSILYLNDDGYAFLLDGKSYYSPYQLSIDKQVNKVPVTWLMRKVYDKDAVSFPPEKASAFSRLQNGDVYYESFEGSYYYLYRDQYMPNTVLVVNNRTVELFDVYNEDNFDLRFSYNGKHWMAVGKKDYRVGGENKSIVHYWIDGELKSVEGFVISDFVVANDGHYSYKAYKDGAPEGGEVVVVDGRVVRRNAKVCYYGLNSQGQLKFRFINNDRYLQYENELITDVTVDLYSTFYPDNVFNGREITVKSNDGNHKLVYQKDRLSVKIDGEEVAQTSPCFALYDESEKSFVWNAIETQGSKTELVIYRYKVQSQFFKNLFKKD